jgi:NhaA family Na+:H+ antiporter
MAGDLTTPVSDNDHMLGPAVAPVTLVEFGDYECRVCLNTEPIVLRLREHFGEKLRIVFRHFPRNSVHPHASAAAEAAEAAGAQGKFWEMHHALFAHQRELADLDLTHLALTLGLDPYKFARDSESRTFPRRVRDHYEGGEQSGVTDTPTFFVNGCRHDGPNDFETLVELIGTVLERGQAGA